MIFHKLEQGSTAWYDARLGIPTASNFHKIITPKGEPSKQAIKYMYRLIAERLLRESQDDQLDFVRWVEHGRTNEPNAVALFEFTNELQLEPGGFVTTNDRRIGCSPDRMLNGGKEAVEIKCPAAFTQIGYLLDGPGEDYRAQVQGQLLVGEFKGVHFFTYHPQMPPFYQVHLPDMRFMGMLQSALSAFCDALDVCTERARALGAYAVVRQVATPADVAYGGAEKIDLQIVNPEDGDGTA
jgi:hypothetical protein